MKRGQLNLTLARTSVTLEEVASAEVEIEEEELRGVRARLDRIAGYAGRAIKMAGGESTSAKGKGKGKAKAVSEDCASEDEGAVEELGEMTCEEPEGANEERPFDEHMAMGAPEADGSRMDLQHIRLEFMKAVMRPMVESQQLKEFWAVSVAIQHQAQCSSILGDEEVSTVPVVSPGGEEAENMVFVLQSVSPCVSFRVFLGPMSNTGHANAAKINTTHGSS